MTASIIRCRTEAKIDCNGSPPFARLSEIVVRIRVVFSSQPAGLKRSTAAQLFFGELAANILSAELMVNPGRKPSHFPAL
jgi:hypothetical protein